MNELSEWSLFASSALTESVTKVNLHEVFVDQLTELTSSRLLGQALVVIPRSLN